VSRKEKSQATQTNHRMNKVLIASKAGPAPKQWMMMPESERRPPHHTTNVRRKKEKKEEGGEKREVKAIIENRQPLSTFREGEQGSRGRELLLFCYSKKTFGREEERGNGKKNRQPESRL